MDERLAELKECGHQLYYSWLSHLPPSIVQALEELNSEDDMVSNDSWSERLPPSLVKALEERNSEDNSSV